jgi:PilZ domain
MKHAFTMEVTVPILSDQGQQEQRREPRQSVRAGVALRVIVADKAGLASGQVIDMTARGCGLRLMKPLTRAQYLTLMVYPDNGTASVLCDLVKVQWVEEDRAGVAFLRILQDHEHRVRQLCSDRLLFEFAE